MSRISIPTADQTAEASKPLLAAVKQQLGVVPNLMPTGSSLQFRQRKMDETPF